MGHFNTFTNRQLNQWSPLYVIEPMELTTIFYYCFHSFAIIYLVNREFKYEQNRKYDVFPTRWI